MNNRRHRRPKELQASPGISPVERFVGANNWIARVHWSPSGDAISAAARESISVWDAGTGQLRFRQPLESFHVFNAVWSPDGHTIASTSDDGVVRFWDSQGGQLISSFEAIPPLPKADRADVRGFTWSPTGLAFATGSDAGVFVWDTASRELRSMLKASSGSITTLWSPDGKYIASTTYEGGVYVWDSQTGALARHFRASYGPALAWSPDSKRIASPDGRQLNIWDIESGLLLHVLEGHHDKIANVAFSNDGKLLASVDGNPPRRVADSRRQTLIWRTDTLEAVGSIEERRAGWYLYAPLAFSPTEAKLATGIKFDEEVQTWDVTALIEARARISVRSAHYKNAKVALLGDSGVGKTGLGLVLSKKPFVATESTHGRQIWMLESGKAETAPGRHEIRELVLWDLAGQPGYRLVHQLHLGDVSLALILFDSRNELDPFSGIRHWHRALKQAKRHLRNPCKQILVAARIDRGPVGVSLARINALLEETGIEAFVKTSAKEGLGVAELDKLMRTSVDWTSVPTVSSNSLFQTIRKFILKEKNAGQILVTKGELLTKFSKTRKATATATPEEFGICIDSLQTLGLVRTFSFGNLVLLQPEALDIYASSIIFAAKDEPDGMGSIAEDIVRLGKFNIPTDKRIRDADKEKLLLIATIEDLVKYEIALREPANDAQLLVFPSQLTRENPDLPDPPGKALSISFDGPLLNIYATLVVRLSHSGIFERQEMWRNAVVFKTGTNARCGLFLVETGEGRGTLTTFFDTSAPEEIRSQFEDYVENHVFQRAVPGSVVKSRAIVCPDPSCATPVSSIAAQRRIGRGFDWIACNVCDQTISLVEPLPAVAMRGTTAQINRRVATNRLQETAMISATGEMHTKGFSLWAGSNLSTLALVFTDVVGSTSLGLALGDEQMGDVRRTHFHVGSSLVRKHKGYLIKTIGDSLMVAFRTATEALNFSIAFQENTGDEKIQIRAGIHVGPVDIEEEDAFGSMVNYAARVVSCAKGVEIWVSDRAHADILQRGARSHKALLWSDHRRTLKGFNEPQLLWRLLRT
jgi:WD40 repeat protein/class 3 adenylate cyclase/GTPase SAR1 family protein